MKGGVVQRITLVLAALAWGLPQPILAQEKPGSSSTQMQGLQKHLLDSAFMVPLGNTSDAALGDTIDLAQDQVITHGRDCFNGLVAERTPHNDIVEHSGSAVNISAALGLAGIADASLGATKIRSYDLSYTDVQTAYVTLIDLRHARSSDEPECRKLVPFLSGDYVASVGERLPVIIGKLVYARRHIRIEFSDSAAAKLQTKSLLARLGGIFTQRTVMDASQQNVLELGGDLQVPIAYQPALIGVDRTVGLKMGAGPQESHVERHLEEFEPDLPSHAAAWSAWVDGTQ